jgi:hypothetical protein
MDEHDASASGEASSPADQPSDVNSLLDEDDSFDPLDNNILDSIGKEASAPSLVKVDKQEKKALFGDDRRDEEKKDALHGAFIWLLRAGILVFSILILIRVFILVAPDKWVWLTDARVHQLDTFLGGAVSGFAARYAKGVLPKSKPN